MKRSTISAAIFFLILSAAVLLLLYVRDPDGRSRENRHLRHEVSEPLSQKPPEELCKGAEDGSVVAQRALSGASREEATSLPSAEQGQQDDDSLSVESFDALTDKWMEPAKAGVSMKAVEEFSARFRKVPRSRKEECLHRALNLVPDENVMLLAGILFDKSLDKDLIETTFNDILNRDEAVKKPIMEQIFKDKSHPCWADVAWILDVTGSLPDKK